MEALLFHLETREVSSPKTFFILLPCFIFFTDLFTL